MEVRVYSNTRRPGVGMAPKREGSRPLLPQHARHCPVLEAGSALGFMVYASLESKESVYVEFEGDGRYKFVYYLQTQSGKRTPIFQVTMSLSVGGVGMMREEVTFVGAPMLSREAALAVMRAFLVTEDMGTPTGAIALRGATNFETPAGSLLFAHGAMLPIYGVGASGPMWRLFAQFSHQAYRAICHDDCRYRRPSRPECAGGGAF